MPTIKQRIKAMSYIPLGYSKKLESFLVEHYIPYFIQRGIIYIPSKDKAYFDYIAKQNPNAFRGDERMSISGAKAFKMFCVNLSKFFNLS